MLTSHSRAAAHGGSTRFLGPDPAALGGGTAAGRAGEAPGWRGAWAGEEDDVPLRQRYGTRSMQ